MKITSDSRAHELYKDLSIPLWGRDSDSTMPRRLGHLESLLQSSI